MENLKKFPYINMISYNIGKMEDMSIYNDETFDVVLTSHVLCSVSDVKLSLEEVHRVLKKVILVSEI